jgi:hypothetical protein
VGARILVCKITLGHHALFQKKKNLLNLHPLPGDKFSAGLQEKFITGQNEREETTQDAIVTKSAAFASYEINYLTCCKLVSANRRH